MDLWQCSVCGYIYDPVKGDPDHDVPLGTKFEDVTDFWVCHQCDGRKDNFVKM
jgi:rubredoxin